MDINYLEALFIVIRSVFSLFILFFVTKLIGKKQASELSLFDYVIGISIGNFTAEVTMNLDYQYINGVVAIVSFGIISYLVSFFSMKNMAFRRFIIGVPTVIIENGKISLNGLKKTNLDINDLLEQCRSLGYFDISEINYAILEVNGKLSVLPKGNYKQPTLNDLKIKTLETTLTSNIIIDGKIMINNLKSSNKSLSWLNKKLIKAGYTSYKNILLATINNNTLNVYEKNTLKPLKVLE